MINKSTVIINALDKIIKAKSEEHTVFVRLLWEHLQEVYKVGCTNGIDGTLGLPVTDAQYDQYYKAGYRDGVWTRTILGFELQPIIGRVDECIKMFGYFREQFEHLRKSVIVGPAKSETAAEQFK